MKSSRTMWSTVVMVVGSMLAGGCGLDLPDRTVVAQRSDQIVVPTSDGAPAEPTTSAEADPPPPVSDPPPPPADNDVILSDLQEAGFCDPVDVEDEGVVTAMHFVVQGQIQSPCYVEPTGAGDGDPRLLDAWNSLTSITPVELVDDISLVAGYEPCSACDTLAFVVALDTEATFFLLAVDVVSGAADPDELRLTMAHELTHVFAQAPGEQLVPQEISSACATFYNGVGCFTEDSYLWAWIQEFWPATELAGLPADGSVDDQGDAEDRCRNDAGYTGSYAAVHPEEDFAETFSAYVYDVDVDAALADKLAFFDRYPEFVAIRENARALGLAGIEGNFEGCGS
jgi:hypothetical protein